MRAKSNARRAKTAIKQINSFSKRFGQSHLYLLYHAAFPLALTPELLYSLWANFRRDMNGRLLNIPWIAVSDILLSSLCEELCFTHKSLKKDGKKDVAVSK